MVDTPGPLPVDPETFVTESGTPLGRLLNLKEVCQVARISESAMRAKLGAKIGPPMVQAQRRKKLFCWEGRLIEWLAADGGDAGAIACAGWAQARDEKAQREKAEAYDF